MRHFLGYVYRRIKAELAVQLHTLCWSGRVSRDPEKYERRDWR